MQEEPITPPKEINFNPFYTQQNGAAYLGDSLKLIKFIDDKLLRS
ncbi:hypothetical protein [Nostoc edaphicum]|nr:hypothetical protein [Nostoc edaphicum]